jgi:tetratricopeptide (TPR) repeat protein
MDRKSDLNLEMEREIGEGIRRTRDIDPPEWLADSVMERVAPKRSRAKKLLSWIVRPRTLTFSPPALALASACIALAFFAGFVSGGRWERTVDGMQKIAATYEMIEADAESSFLMGRSLLAAGHTEEAVSHLRRAVELSPLHVDYRLWLGRAYAAAGLPDRESRQYKLAAAIDHDSLRSLRELAGSYLRAGRYESAAAEYERVLAAEPKDPAALYGRAVAMYRLGREEPARDCLKSLLALDANGILAVEAASLLNELGDYEYRATVIGRRRIALKTPEFNKAEPTPRSRRDLIRVAKILSHSRNTVLHVVAYVVGDPAEARRRAMVVKRTLMNSAPDISGERIKTSWFGSAEELKNGDSIPISVSIFGLLDTKPENQGVRT